MIGMPHLKLAQRVFKAAGLPDIAGQGSSMMPGGEYLAWLSPSSA